MKNTPYYARADAKILAFNRWDLVILVLIFGVFAALVWSAQQMVLPYELNHAIPISLEPQYLPGYALKTVLRMAIALFFSLLFTFTIGTLAAKNTHAARFIIPFIDIMQSVPILGFLSISILAFIHLFPHSQLGPECAAIFAIFTSQVWNITLCFYQALRSVPKDLVEATATFHLNAWQRFCRLEVPFALPSLIWNIMMSLSGGWFFVVASEAISVNNHNITLPGLGSYITIAIQQANYHAIGYVIATMFLVILIYDQLIFRPLISWSAKFKLHPSIDEASDPWFRTLLQRAVFIHTFLRWCQHGIDVCARALTFQRFSYPLPLQLRHNLSWLGVATWNTVLLVGFTGAVFFLGRFIYLHLSLSEVLTVFGLGIITTIKVAVMIVLVSLIWVPIGVYVGLRPKITAIVQPIAQFCASFPANLIYPLIFMLVVTFNLNVNIWSAPLMILGTQWYILFNVIAGANNLPEDYHLVAQNFGVKRWLWWKKLMLPAIFRYYITGAINAAGGAWNASIVAEVIQWGDHTFLAIGLGSYIAEYTKIGDFPRIALGIAVMALYVIVVNRLVWHKLYLLAENRYHIGAS